MLSTEITDLQLAQRAATHVRQLHDSDINALLDRYVFLHDPWCAGYSDIDADGVYRCQQCGSREQPCDGSAHRRHVPQYSIEQITAAMAMQSQAMQLCFAQLVAEAAAPVGELHGSIGELRSILFALSPRLVATAALKAMCIINMSGDLRRLEL